MTIPTLFDYLIGFDQDFLRLQSIEMKSPTFPPFDLYEEKGKTVLEFALAGHSKEDIKVSVKNSTLEITASRARTRNPENKYLHQGIGLRSFYKQYILSENAVVESAEFKDGILKIVIAVVVPEDKKVLQIPIL